MKEFIIATLSILGLVGAASIFFFVWLNVIDSKKSPDSDVIYVIDHIDKTGIIQMRASNQDDIFE